MYNYVQSLKNANSKNALAIFYKVQFLVFSHASSPRNFLYLCFFLLFFMRIVSTSCSVSTSYIFLSDILLSVWLIFNTIFLNWKLITLALLTYVVALLAASFDNIWNSMEYVINLDDIWRYLSKTFDIWVERYLTIFNDNLAIFDNRNVHTGAKKLSSKRYRQVSSFIAQWEPSLIGSRVVMM